MPKYQISTKKKIVAKNNNNKIYKRKSGAKNGIFGKLPLHLAATMVIMTV
jgi:hypothetical protein